MVRVFQHRAGTFEGFSKTYRCNRLVYFERFGEMTEAIAREKQLKRWSRTKKLALIEKTEPFMDRLSEGWGKPAPLERLGM